MPGLGMTLALLQVSRQLINQPEHGHSSGKTEIQEKPVEPRERWCVGAGSHQVTSLRRGWPGPPGASPK